MLLETRSVTQMALLFGSTWNVNAVVFISILLAILATNWMVQAGVAPRREFAYAFLFASLGIWLFIPVREVAEPGFSPAPARIGSRGGRAGCVCVCDIFHRVQRGEAREPGFGLESSRDRFRRGAGIHEQYLGAESSLSCCDDPPISCRWRRGMDGFQRSRVQRGSKFQLPCPVSDNPDLNPVPLKQVDTYPNASPRLAFLP